MVISLGFGILANRIAQVVAKTKNMQINEVLAMILIRLFEKSFPKSTKTPESCETNINKIINVETMAIIDNPLKENVR